MIDRVLDHLPGIDIVPMGRATRVPDWYGVEADNECYITEIS